MTYFYSPDLEDVFKLTENTEGLKISLGETYCKDLFFPKDRYEKSKNGWVVDFNSIKHHFLIKRSLETQVRINKDDKIIEVFYCPISEGNVVSIKGVYMLFKELSDKSVFKKCQQIISSMYIENYENIEIIDRKKIEHLLFLLENKLTSDYNMEEEEITPLSEVLSEIEFNKQ